MSGGNLPEIFPVRLSMQVGAMRFWHRKKDEGFPARTDAKIVIYQFSWYKKGVFYGCFPQSWN